MKVISVLFILSVFAFLINTATAEIKITDADAVFETSLQSVSILTQAIPVTTLFINSVDAILTKELLSVHVPTQAMPLTRLFIVGADALFTEDLVRLSPQVYVEYPRWDVNEDGIVDIFDIILVGIHLGEDYRTVQMAAKRYDIGAFSGKTADVRMEVRNKVTTKGTRLLVVDIEAEPAEDLYGCQFNLYFDPKALKVAGIKPGGLLSKDAASTYWSVSKIDNKRGKIEDVIYARKATKTGITAGGRLATVIFEVREFPISGVTELNLNDVRFVDADARLIKVVTGAAFLKWEELFVPEKSRLLQNYPNPFNPDTWIPYQLVEDADVNIKIYNVAGQLVRTLYLGHKPAGFYINKHRAAYWDGRHETGEKVASGVYFYTIQAGGYTATKKMVTAE